MILDIVFVMLMLALALSIMIWIYQRVAKKGAESSAPQGFYANLFAKSNAELKEAILALATQSAENNAKLLEANERIAKESTATITNALDSANKRALEALDSLKAALDSAMTKQTQMLDSAITTAKNLADSAQNTLDSAIRELDFNLKKELEKLSANFSADVINALDTLANRYEKEISTHFSQNFARFNNAVENLLAWQAEYRQSVINSNEILSHSTQNLQKIATVTDSILQRDEATGALYREVSAIMKDYKTQSAMLDEKLKAMRDVGNGALSAIKFMGEFFERLNTDLRSVNENMATEVKRSVEGIVADLGKRDANLNAQMAKSAKFLDELIKAILSSNKALHESYAKLNKDVELNSRAISKNTSEMISAINKDGIKHLKNTTKLYFDDITNAQQSVLKTMSKQLNNHYESLDSALVAMSAKYLESLEQISISSVNASKDLNLVSVEGIRNLNDEIARFVRKNSDNLKKSSDELLAILDLVKSQVEGACARTDKIQNKTNDFMRDLETSLQSASDNFKGDYEWFLKRVREIIGARK